MRRWIAVLAVAAALAACGQTEEAQRRDAPSGATRSVSLPDPVEAVAAYEVRPSAGETLPDPGDIEAVPGIRVAAPISIGRVSARSTSGWRGKLQVAGAPPLALRALAPAATRDADFVWTALLSGDVVLSFDAARRIEMDRNDALRLEGLDIDVGAFADNGVPNIADALVSDQAGLALGLADPDRMLVGVRPGAPLEPVERALRRRGLRVRRVLPTRPAPVEPAVAPEQVGESSGSIIGTMRFRILKNGYIDPDDAWVEANIASAEVPLIGTATCHRLLLPQLYAALAEVQERGLAEEIRPGDYGGCYVPRFINRDPRRALSMHAFGLALDLNVSTNHYGTRGDMDPRIVDVFEKWGFAWGGYWDPPDPMHFELVRLVET